MQTLCSQWCQQQQQSVSIISDISFTWKEVKSQWWLSCDELSQWYPWQARCTSCQSWEAAAAIGSYPGHFTRVEIEGYAQAAEGWAKLGHATSHCSCWLVQVFHGSCWYISGTFSWWPWEALDWKAADGELGFPAVEPSWHDHVVDLQYITHGLFLCYCCIHVIYACCIHLCCQCHCKKNV